MTVKIDRRYAAMGLAAVLAGGALGRAVAATTLPRYAVLSLIGDKITLVGYNPAVRGRLDQNERLEVAMPNRNLDRSALFAVEDALGRAEPGAKALLLAANDATLYARQDELFGSPEQARALLTDIRKLLPADAPERLLLITKHRAEARLRLTDGHFGSGSLRGLGFYVDNVTEMRDVNSGIAATGFISSFAYLRVSLVDVRSLTILRDDAGKESVMATAAGQSDVTRPWDALSPEQKARYLETAIQRAIDQVAPRVLAAR